MEDEVEIALTEAEVELIQLIWVRSQGNVEVEVELTSPSPLAWALLGSKLKLESN